MLCSPVTAKKTSALFSGSRCRAAVRQNWIHCLAAGHRPARRRATRSKKRRHGIIVRKVRRTGRKIPTGLPDRLPSQNFRPLSGRQQGNGSQRPGSLPTNLPSILPVRRRNGPAESAPPYRCRPQTLRRETVAPFPQTSKRWLPPTRLAHERIDANVRGQTMDLGPFEKLMSLRKP
jgi:hypothetical protein